MISHDQLTAMATAVRAAASFDTLARGVYTTLHFGVPFCFAVKSDGTGYVGAFLPDGMPEEVMLERLLDRLEMDDQPVLRLLA